MEDVNLTILMTLNLNVSNILIKGRDGQTGF